MTKPQLITLKNIESQIYKIRDKNVMFDFDLAKLYKVTTGSLNQSVKRNMDRFPEDFMFQLSKKELENWMSQFVISNPKVKMSLRKPPNVFTEHGILMLSSVLRSKTAINANIQIMRTFNKMRQTLFNYNDLNRKIEYLEQRYDNQFKIVFDAIKKLMAPPKSSDKKKKKIGFGQ